MIKRLRQYLGLKYDKLREIIEQLRIIKFNIFRQMVIFDVGANSGSSFSVLPKIAAKVKIYAFEPTPELADVIDRRFQGLTNYHLTRKAVGENPGMTTFNVSDGNDGGCSSLLEFAENVSETWPGRTELKVDRRLEVEVVRLDGFVKEHKIERIDFIHIDTQGTDLSVLRSLGSDLDKVQAGVIEVPQSETVKLYKNQHSREEAISFLESNGFKITRNVVQQNEENLFFERKSV